MERKRPFEVLFICTGNSCRSPMAEGILRELLRGRAAAGDGRAAAVVVASAGTHAPQGAPATQEAVEACAALGADLTAHRARRLTAEILAAADLVLVMEPFHLSGVYARSPDASRKTWLLTEFAGDSDSDGVPDPIGASAAVYRETCARLETLLRAALPRLLEQAAQTEQTQEESGDRTVRIHLGNDHRGYALKQRARAWLEEHGHEVVDHGSDGPEACDYPDHAFAVARAVVAHPGDLGVVICSNGVGVSMAANKVPGARAALAVTPAMASQSRRHNDANVLALGADNVSTEENLRILETWLAASFEGGRHARRVEKMTQGEREGCHRRSATADQGGKMKTDPGCIFCRIVAGQIPAEKVHEDEHVLAFRDLHPAAPFHALIIPKEHIPTLNALEEEHDALMGRVLRAAGTVAAAHGLGAGYRLVGNCERAAGQEVFHIHFHMLGGRALGWPPG